MTAITRPAVGCCRAPRAGVIARRLVEVGQVVAASQTVFTLAADGRRGADRCAGTVR
ncbi:MAG: HlyD family efflux transporter periplasmic adaptor subunit [Gammaproteobacteria bacterium]